MISQSANTSKLIEQLNFNVKVYTPETLALAARSIDQPVLIAWGEKDQIINVEAAAELKGLLKNAKRSNHIERRRSYANIGTGAVTG